jgi:hypothetical protein
VRGGREYRARNELDQIRIHATESPIRAAPVPLLNMVVDDDPFIKFDSLAGGVKLLIALCSAEY